MAKLPQNQTLAQLQSKWPAQLNPVLANLLVNGQLLTDQVLNNGTTVINHKMGAPLNGWFLVSPQGAALVYQASQQPNPTLTLTLVSDAAITTGIWVF
jgi:hypothetical protein